MELLREKNLFLEKFFAINELELIRFGDGAFEGVEEFYNEREKILELIKCIDLILAEEANVLPITIGDEDKLAIQSIMNEKNEWVKAILAQDLRVLSYIESEKSDIIRELQSTRMARKAVGAYHSGGRSRQLDEKA
jgi:hypothetical protein